MKRKNIKLILISVPILITFIISLNYQYFKFNNQNIQDIDLQPKLSGSTPKWTSNVGAGNKLCAAISSNGTYIAAGFRDNGLFLFNDSSNTPLWSNYNDTRAVAISSDGMYIVGGGNHGKVYLYNRTSPIPIWSYPISLEIFSIEISSDGNYFTAGSATTLYYFNFTDKTSPSYIWGHSTDTPHDIAMSSDGKNIVAGSTDGKVYYFNSSGLVWDFTTITGFDVEGVAISSNGRYIAAGGWSHEHGGGPVRRSLCSSTGSLGEKTTASASPREHWDTYGPTHWAFELVPTPRPSLFRELP